MTALRAAKLVKEDTRCRILNAARTLMTEMGMLDVSLSQISEKAGTNVALVSYYFGGREGLMVAIAEADAKFATEQLDRLLAEDIFAADKIRIHIKGIINTYFDRPYLYRLLQHLVRAGSPDAVARVKQCFMLPVVEARRTIINKGISDGEFTAIDPGMVSLALDGACANIFSAQATCKVALGNSALTKAVIDRYADTVTRLILPGLLSK